MAYQPQNGQGPTQRQALPKDPIWKGPNVENGTVGYGPPGGGAVGSLSNGNGTITGADVGSLTDATIVSTQPGGKPGVVSGQQAGGAAHIDTDSDFDNMAPPDVNVYTGTGYSVGGGRGGTFFPDTAMQQKPTKGNGNNMILWVLAGAAIFFLWNQKK